MRSACILLALFWFLVISRMGFSQSDPNNPNETGMHPYETYDGARENVNLATGNLYVSVPLLKLPGRNGFDFSITLNYNSQIWTPNPLPGGGAWNQSQSGFQFVSTGQIQLTNSAVNPTSNVSCIGNYDVTLGDGSVVHPCRTGHGS